MKYISEESYRKRVDEIQKINLALHTLYTRIEKEKEMLKEEQKRIFEISDALEKYVFNIGIDSDNPQVRFAFQLGTPSQQENSNNEI